MHDLPLQTSLPTIVRIVGHGGKAILLTHQGDPQGKQEASLKLTRVASAVQTMLSRPVPVVEGINTEGQFRLIHDGVRARVKAMQPGDIVMLDNTRFDPREQSTNSEERTALAKELAALADYFVLDGFPAAHRQEASVMDVARLLPGLKGYAIRVEADKHQRFLKRLVAPERGKLTVILGGDKLDKLGLINKLLPLMRPKDCILLAGLMPEAIPDDLQEIIEQCHIELLGPVDAGSGCLDIGPKTIERYGRKLEDAELVYWHGPAGRIEEPPNDQGTRAIAQAIQLRSYHGKSFLALISGVETARAFSGLSHEPDERILISTGGSASTAFLAGVGSLDGFKNLGFMGVPLAFTVEDLGKLLLPQADEAVRYEAFRILANRRAAEEIEKRFIQIAKELLPRGPDGLDPLIFFARALMQIGDEGGRSSLARALAMELANLILPRLKSELRLSIDPSMSLFGTLTNWLWSAYLPPEGDMSEFAANPDDAMFLSAAIPLFVALITPYDESFSTAVLNFTGFSSEECQRAAGVSDRFLRYAMQMDLAKNPQSVYGDPPSWDMLRQLLQRLQADGTIPARAVEQLQTARNARDRLAAMIQEFSAGIKRKRRDGQEVRRGFDVDMDASQRVLLLRCQYGLVSAIASVRWELCMADMRRQQRFQDQLRPVPPRYAGDPAALLAEAQEDFSQKKYELAAEKCAQIMAADPKNLSARILHIKSLAGADKYWELIASIDAGLEFYPDDLDLLEMQATRGQLSKGIAYTASLCHEIVARDSGRAAAVLPNLLSRCMYVALTDAEDRGNALDAAAAVLDLPLDQYDWQEVMGRLAAIYDQMGDAQNRMRAVNYAANSPATKAAAEKRRQSLGLSSRAWVKPSDILPWTEEVYLRKGRESMEAGNFGRAIGLMRKVLQENPACREAYAILVESFAHARRQEEFDSTLAEGLRIFPDDLALLELNIYGLLGKHPQEAVALGHSILSRDPARAQAFVGLLNAYAVMNNFDKALDAAASALSMPIRDDDWNTILGRLAMLYNEMGSASQAEIIRRLLTAGPAYNPAQHRAEILSELGLAGRRLVISREAREHSPGGAAAEGDFDEGAPSHGVDLGARRIIKKNDARGGSRAK